MRSNLGLISTLSHADFLAPASLGINGTKSAYVPPHMRNAQRATPPLPSPAGCVSVQFH